MSDKSFTAKLLPPDAAMAALCVAQKLSGCDERALHDFLDGQKAIGQAPRNEALALTRDILDAPKGFDTLLDMLAASLSAAQSPTVYMLCADFIAQHGTVSPEEMRFLDRLGEALMIDRLSRAAFDRAAQALAAPLTGDDNG